MSAAGPASAWLERVRIDAAVRALRPDYRVLLVAAEGLRPGPGDALSERALADAERHALAELEQVPITEAAHLRQWRDAYVGFGAKPKRTRPSVEALLRRLPRGLPRIDRLTDTYNAVSVRHQLPVGGEDLDRFVGPLRLVRAQGDEQFDTVADGVPALETPEQGEVVWRDDVGVTCRRWNWRQCHRTRLGPRTTRAVFILEALGDDHTDRLAAAGEHLCRLLAQGHPDAVLVQRLLPG